MRNKIFIISGIFLGLVIQGCNSADSRNLDLEIAVQTPTPQTAIITEKKVEFKGVSFTYNPKISGEVETEEINEDRPLERETDKPGENFPKHLAFYFKQMDSMNHPKPKGRIVIIPIENYRQMYAVCKSCIESFDEQLKGIQKVSANEKFRIEKQMPFIPFYDASQAFQNKVKRISFENGKGFFFLTQFLIESQYINNEELEYIFQGVTNDKRYYILAQFSVRAACLPDDYDANGFEGYKIPTYFFADKSGQNQKHYNEYLSKIAGRLEKLPQNEFEPNLNQLEKIISTLKIEK